MDINGFVQICSISIGIKLEKLEVCIKPSIWNYWSVSDVVTPTMSLCILYYHNIRACWMKHIFERISVVITSVWLHLGVGLIKLHFNALVQERRNSSGSAMELHFSCTNPSICWFCGYEYSTLNVRGPSYLSLTRSVSRLLMPWLLTSPGHQRPWYWLCRICRSWSYLRKDLKYLCHINVE